MMAAAQTGRELKMRTATHYMYLISDGLSYATCKAREEMKRDPEISITMGHARSAMYRIQTADHGDIKSVY